MKGSAVVPPLFPKAGEGRSFRRHTASRSASLPTLLSLLSSRPQPARQPLDRRGFGDSVPDMASLRVPLGI
jgi:hypothetical protein